jgi:hypothetical protein
MYTKRIRNELNKWYFNGWLEEVNYFTGIRQIWFQRLNGEYDFCYENYENLQKNKSLVKKLKMPR